MRYTNPSTVNVTANATDDPAMPFTASVFQHRSLNAIIWQTLSVDVFLAIVSVIIGLLFSRAVAEVDPTTTTANISLLMPPLWLIFFICVLPTFICLLLDGLSIFSNPSVLPFAGSPARVKAVYAKRVHLLLLAFYFTAILVALCWSAFSMLLVSKIFVSAIFALALYSLGQSIPSQRLSFIISGILFLIVLIGTQIFIVRRLEADSLKASQELLQDTNSQNQDRGGLKEASEENLDGRL